MKLLTIMILFAPLFAFANTAQLKCTDTLQSLLMASPPCHSYEFDGTIDLSTAQLTNFTAVYWADQCQYSTPVTFGVAEFNFQNQKNLHVKSTPTTLSPESVAIDLQYQNYSAATTGWVGWVTRIYLSGSNPGSNGINFPVWCSIF